MFFACKLPIIFNCCIYPWHFSYIRPHVGDDEVSGFFGERLEQARGEGGGEGLYHIYFIFKTYFLADASK